MKQQRNEDGFVVVGLSAKVRNDDPAAIGALWGAFRADAVRSKLGPDASEDVYCVYHDYDGGFMDPYRMTIGHRMPKSASVPIGLHCAEVPPQKIAIYEATGPQPDTLIAQWQAIWDGDLNRSYIADYDIYDKNNPDLVTVAVGIEAA
ncbi:GyrI-like domain-containing protein [Yoonia sp. GPGPB17]|uniref:GyrI-like domain-containing protein n=1 Tax=Yoonia sp. GPGPB17 TaxID=3026147 RepID=UPI0030C40A96